MTDNRSWRGRTSLRIFGRRAVLEALAEPTVELELVRVATRTPAAFRKELRAACRARDAALEETEFPAVTELSGDARNDQGVAAVIRLTNVTDAETFAAGLTGAAARTPTRLIAADGVTNPQNLGMIVRSAAAFGLAGVLWPLAGSPWISGLVIKGSAATVYRTPIITCPTLAEGLATLRGFGFQTLGLDARGDTTLHNLTPHHRAAFVIGGETLGLARDTRDCLDGLVRIDMHAGVESLNAAVAASLVCYELSRPR
jgi:23S rRNA (guanosine2251-2'-O)-methyltransferase